MLTRYYQVVARKPLFIHFLYKGYIMNITFISIAIIAGLSSAATTPLTGTSIKPAQTELFSKSELIHIISSEQKTSISFDDLRLTVPSLTIDNTVFIAKASKKDSVSTKTEIVIGDDE